MMRRLLAWLGRLLDRIPRFAGWILAAATLAFLLAASAIVDPRDGSVQLEVDVSADRLLPDRDASRRFYERSRRMFGSDETLLVAISDDDVFRPEVLARIEAMTERIERVEGVHHVLSLSNALDVRMVGGDIEIAPFVEEIPPEAEALQTLRERVASNPIYAGSLVSKDGRSSSLLVYLLDMSNREYLQRGIGRQIEEIVQEERGSSEVWITGAPRVREVTARVLLGETLSLSLLILGAMGGVLLFSFRTLRGVSLPLLTIVVAVGWTLGVVVFAGYSLNAVTALVPPILTALGLSYSVHVISEYYYVAREQPELRSRELVAKAMQQVALPVILTGVTTAAGFSSLLLSPLAAVREFGAVAVLGVLFTVLASLTVAPALLSLLGPPRGDSSWFGRARSGRLHRSIERIAHFDFRQRYAIYAVAALLFAASLYGATQIRVGSQQISKFREDAPVRVDFESVNRALEGANPFSVVVESSAPKAFQEPLNLREIEALQRWLDEQPEIGGTTSMVDYLGLIHRGFREELPDGSRIPESRRLVGQLFFFGASEELDRLVDSRFQSTSIQVRARVIDSDDIAALKDRIDARLAELPRHLEGTVTGSVVVFNQALDAIIEGQALSMVAALLIIYLILAAMFVSFRVGLIALLPNVLPVAAFFGALGWSGVRLDAATSLIGPMVLGIAVDDTIHYFSRFIQEAKRLGNEERATVSALQSVGRPVTFTSIALCLGFLTLNASELRSQGELGSMAAFTLAFAWATDFFLTPALCARLRIATLWDLLAVDLGENPHRTIGVFAGLRATQARIVALMGSVLELRRGERLFHAGEPGGSFYVVIDGRLRASVRHADGHRAINEHGRGEVVGEVGLFHGERTADVDALEASRLLRLSEACLDQLGRRYPRIASSMLRNLNEVQATRLARVTRWLVGDEDRAVPAELRERGRTLNDVFFRAEADRYRAQLSRPDASPAEALPEEGASRRGPLDAALVERLTLLGIRADTLAALTLIPLVEVAWADGSMDGREQEAVLAAARSNGISADDPSFALLRLWLEEPPGKDLLAAWRAYIRAVTRELSVETRLRLKETLVGRARAVAESAGGFMGLAAVSREEELALTELEAAFEPARDEA